MAGGSGEGKKMRGVGGCGLLETASGVFVMQAAAGAQKCFAEGEDMSGFSSDVVKRDQDHKKKKYETGSVSDNPTPHI